MGQSETEHMACTQRLSMEESRESRAESEWFDRRRVPTASLATSMMGSTMMGSTMMGSTMMGSDSIVLRSDPIVIESDPNGIKNGSMIGLDGFRV